ncbi:MAG TPA: IspD/TarI family cytidylyltransferase [Mycobacteriales bacterium]
MDGYGSAAGVVLAGGSGSRLGAAGNKVYLPLAGRPLLAWSLSAFAAAGVGRLVLVVRAQDRELAEQVAVKVAAPVEIVLGGPSRHASEHNGLARLATQIDAGGLDVVAIHDGARPFVRPALVRACLDEARRYGAAVPGVAMDGVGTTVGSEVTEVTEGGEGAADGRPRLNPLPKDTGPLVRVQTPQAFRAGPLLAAYQRAAVDGFTGTDTAACVERYTGIRIHHLTGDVRNIKVTFQHDLAVAEALAQVLPVCS